MLSDDSAGVTFTLTFQGRLARQKRSQGELWFLGVGHTVALRATVGGWVVSGRSGGGGVFGRFPRGFPWRKSFWEPTLA